MGLFTSLFPSKVMEKKSEKKEVFVLIGSLNYGLRIVGGDHHQKALAAICGPHKRGGVHQLETAWLVLEDKDGRDQSSVRVEIRGKQIGYLSQKAATLYRRQLIANHMPEADGRCQAVIMGGWISSDGRKGEYEVWLDAPCLAC
jgi:hypothetical protein